MPLFLSKNKLSRLIESQVDEGVRKRITAATGFEKEDVGWRRITDAMYTKDLSPLKHDKHLGVVQYLYQRNPQAKRIIDMSVDFILGDGIKYKAKDKDVQKVLDRFWLDSDNAWPLKQFARVKELGLWGEYVPKVFITPLNGHVKLAGIDPKDISKIEPKYPGVALTSK